MRKHKGMQFSDEAYETIFKRQDIPLNKIVVDGIMPNTILSKFLRKKKKKQERNKKDRRR